MRPAISEKDFSSAVVELAELRGWTYAHFLPAQRANGRWVTPMQGDTGFPDLVLARRGTVLFRELKTERGVVAPGQRHWGEQLGDLFGIWRPSDIERIQKELR